MSIEIKTTSIEPLRHTFTNVAARLGKDKPASRYQEATFDLQPTVNFHYRPTWDKDHELYDQGRTAIKMEDWYSFRDPRQLYYGAWTMARAKQQEVAERNFAFVERRNLLDSAKPEGRQLVADVIVPLRHLEYAANLNNCYITGYGYGTAITQATSFNAIDRLGIAQYLTRLGLLLDGNSAEVLDAGKQAWLEADYLQPLRELTEQLLVTKDWFELYVAQNIVLDGLLYPLIYEKVDAALIPHAGSTFSMLMEFQNEWYGENVRWVDATLKTAAGESDENREQLAQWISDWTARCRTALIPLADKALGNGKGEAVIDELINDLQARLEKKAGLALAA
ncbi:MAG: aromatic/alkene monooxygenase hydroxylase subunit beta [Saccharospirillum sp.]|nr:aromatic/alkene monooxygenase hydroxylase subunit beta [Saccharospirillum sp.]